MSYIADQADAKKNFDAAKSQMEADIASEKKQGGFAYPISVVASVSKSPDAEAINVQFKNGTANPDESIHGVILYQAHFVITLKGSLIYSDSQTAKDLTHEFLAYGISVSDAHYR